MDVRAWPGKRDLLHSRRANVSDIHRTLQPQSRQKAPKGGGMGLRGQMGRLPLPGVVKDGKNVRLLPQPHRMDRPPANLARMFAGFQATSAIIDGELASAMEGRPDFRRCPGPAQTASRMKRAYLLRPSTCCMPTARTSPPIAHARKKKLAVLAERRPIGPCYSWSNIQRRRRADAVLHEFSASKASSARDATALHSRECRDWLKVNARIEGAQCERWRMFRSQQIRRCINALEPPLRHRRDSRRTAGGWRRAHDGHR